TMIVWILICVFCWFVAVRSFWRCCALEFSSWIRSEEVPEGSGISYIWFGTENGAIDFQWQIRSHVNDYPELVRKLESKWSYFSRPSFKFKRDDLRDALVPDFSKVGFRSTYRIPGIQYPVGDLSEVLSHGTTLTIRLPWWLILTILHTPLPFILRARRTRHRRENGLCVKCCYDLRASSERCPECGTMIGNKTEPRTK